AGVHRRFAPRPRLDLRIAISTINVWTSPDTRGRPLGRDFHFQTVETPFDAIGQRLRLDDDKRLAPIKQSGQLGHVKRTESVAIRGLFFRSTNSPSCLRRNRFSAANAEDDRKLRAKSDNASTKTPNTVSTNAQQKPDIEIASHKIGKLLRP